MEDQKSADVQTAVSQYDPATEARVRRKLDWNLMPLFFVLCKSNQHPYSCAKVVQLTAILWQTCLPSWIVATLVMLSLRE